MRRLLEKANWITLAILVSVIQFSIYYFLSATVRGDGFLSVAQPDASLYFQAARRIVEGGAFTFSAGGSVHTGTTSVLYPFVLAVPYWLGFKGASMVTAGFILNAIFYLTFIVCWLQVIDVKVREPIAKVASAFLLALFSQFAFVSLAQSDIGLWLAVSALFALGLARNITLLWATMLMLSPWIRPEGMVCVIAVTLVAFVVRHYRGVALLGLLSVGGVFLLNYYLTGAWQFSSVQGKGYFMAEPFFRAVVLSFGDAVTMVRQLFLGLSFGSFREMFFFPVLGAVCLWYHLFRRDYTDFDACEAIFLLASAGGFATVAMSGWQGTNFDRYLAWFMPVAVIWTACGAVELGMRLNGVSRFLPLVLILGFGLAGSVTTASNFRLDCERMAPLCSFYEHCEKVLPKDASFGSFGNADSVYWLSPRRFAHLCGIYSPEFKSKNIISALEILKHEPTLRFDYWLYCGDIEGDLVEESSRLAFGEPILLGPMGRELRKTDWSTFDAANEVPPMPASGLVFKKCIDVGYEVDEKAADYRAYGAYGQNASEPFFRLDALGKRKVADVGRVITGGDEMTLSGLTPGKDLYVVMRTALRQRAVRESIMRRVSDEYVLATSQTLQVFAERKGVGMVSYRVPENGIADVTFRVPAAAVPSGTIRLMLLGEHISFGYWFYQ